MCIHCQLLAQVNGEPLLSVEYGETETSETVYSGGRERLLTIRYDASGRPVRAIPAGPLDGLNITYDSRGRVSGWWRGDLAVSNAYDDRTGLLVERRLANKILQRFIYKAGNKVSCQPSWFTMSELMMHHHHHHHYRHHYHADAC